VPAQSVMPAVLSSTAARSCDLRVGAADCGQLLELLSLVPDPRCRRGVRHTVASILAIAAAAVLAGCTSFLAEVAGFASLASAGGDQADPPGPGGSGRQQEQPGQERREQGGEGQDAARADMPLAGALSVDGKAARGARQADGRAVHLLSALVHGTRYVIAQRNVAHKTNEIPQVKELLGPLDLRGWAVTLDAMHCQRETARFLAEDKKAAYVFTAAKDNQPGLVAKLDALPWQNAIAPTLRWVGRNSIRALQFLSQTA
jgi:predicted transposase YbfD/YdcC